MTVTKFIFRSIEFDIIQTPITYRLNNVILIDVSNTDDSSFTPTTC